MKNYKCPDCHATLVYDNDKKCFKCEYCRGEFDLVNFEEPSTTEFSIYNCPDCGSKVLTSLELTSCIYCHNNSIIKNSINTSFEYIIPFKYNKEDILKEYKKLYRGRFFIPSVFKKKKVLNNMIGLYVQSMLFNYNVSGEVKFESDKFNKWKSGNYNYIKSDIYNSARSGSMEFENIAIYSDFNLEKKLIDFIAPFDYDEIKKFNSSYIENYVIDANTVSKEDSTNKVKEIVSNTFIDNLKNDLIGYDSIRVVDNKLKLHNTKCVKVLLPIWILNIEYKNKLYEFCINGETGKVYGVIPISKFKIVVLGLFIFAFFFILLLGLYYLKVIL